MKWSAVKTKDISASWTLGHCTTSSAVHFPWRMEVGEQRRRFARSAGPRRHGAVLAAQCYLRDDLAPALAADLRRASAAAPAYALPTALPPDSRRGLTRSAQRGSRPCPPA